MPELTPQQIINGMQDKNRALTQKNGELVDLAEKSAQTKREFDVLYANKVLKLKQDGQPVTIIRDIAKGDPVVADFKFKADVAEAVYSACRESIKDIRAAIDTYRSILTWLREELKVS